MEYTDQFNTDLKTELRQLVKSIQDKANKTGCKGWKRVLQW